MTNCEIEVLKMRRQIEILLEQIHHEFEDNKDFENLEETFRVLLAIIKGLRYNIHCDVNLEVHSRLGNFTMRVDKVEK